MQIRRSFLASAAVVALTWTTTWTIPAHALSMQECGAKYRAAQTAKTLNGMTWKEFRKAECGAGAAAAPSGTSANTADTAAPAAAPTPSIEKPSKTTRIFNTAPATDQTNAVFPAAVSAKYAAKSAGRARMLTCLDQYEANKAGNLNGGLKWIQKGGGYYSMCNKRLKGA
jgi:hypothetical protein